MFSSWMTPLNLGLNGSALQLATLNGLDRVCVALKVDVNVVLVASAPQLVGLKRKFGRLTATLMLRSRNGTPLKIVGSVLAAMTRPLCGSTPIATRVTIVPRSNGPAAAWIGIDRPYGAPPYGPVRKTGPVNGYGSPAPTFAVAVPIWLADVQAPACACGSPHNVTDGIAPTSPAGRTVVIFDRYCCPSARARLNV